MVLSHDHYVFYLLKVFILSVSLLIFITSCKNIIANICFISLLFLRSDLMGGIRVALTTTDNSVRIINTSTMKEEWTLHSLCLTSKKNSIFKKSIKNRGQKEEQPAATQQFLQSDNSWNVQLKCEFWFC